MQGSALHCKQITCSWRTWSCKDQWYQWVWGTVSRFIILQLVAWQRHSKKAIKQAVLPSFSCFDHRQFSVIQLQCGLVPEFLLLRVAAMSGAMILVISLPVQPRMIVLSIFCLLLFILPLFACDDSATGQCCLVPLFDLCFPSLSPNHHLHEFLSVEFLPELRKL